MQYAQCTPPLYYYDITQGWQENALFAMPFSYTLPFNLPNLFSNININAQKISKDVALARQAVASRKVKCTNAMYRLISIGFLSF